MLLHVKSTCSWSFPVNNIWKSSRQFFWCSKHLNWQLKINRCGIILKIKFAFTWCQRTNSLHNVSLDKNISKLKWITCRFNHKTQLFQNVALSLNGMHLNTPSTECRPVCRASMTSGADWEGTGYARAVLSFPSLISEFHRNSVIRVPHTDMIELLISLLKGFRSLLEVLLSHCRREVKFGFQFDILFAQSPVHCDNKSRQIGLNHDYNMTFLISPQEC